MLCTGVLADISREYSTLFWGAVAVVASAAVCFLYRVWNNFSLRKQIVVYTHREPSVFVPVAISIITVTILIVGASLSWNMLVENNSTISTYKTAAEVAEEKRVRETPTPTTQELERTVADLHDKTRVKPHQGALSSFDEEMRKEEERIRQRSLGATQPTTASSN